MLHVQVESIPAAIRELRTEAQPPRGADQDASQAQGHADKEGQEAAKAARIQAMQDKLKAWQAQQQGTDA